MIGICKKCKKEFKYSPSHKRKFCFSGCYWEWMIGNKGCKPKTGRYKSCLECGGDMWVTKSTEKTKKYCSKRCADKNNPIMAKTYDYDKRNYSKGEKHHCWKGGVTPEMHKIRNGLDTRKWRDGVFRRDNFTCRKCYQKGYFHVHHIKNFSQYPHLRFRVNNGITFCVDCHMLFHKIYKKKDNNYKQIHEFIVNI